jgi:DNA primase
VPSFEISKKDNPLMFADDSEKEQVRSRTDIVALISQYTPLRRVGSKFKGLCPFHTEKTPSFNVDPEMGRWHCFGACSEGGDAFKFLQKIEGLSFPEALERLAERAGITLTRTGQDREEAQRQQTEKDRLFSVNALALRFFRETMGRARMAQEYTKRRGLAHETMEQFGVGYAPDDWSGLSEFLLSQRVHLEDAEKAGLVFASRRGDGTYTDKFRGRLMFPILDIQERIVGFGGRLLVPAENAPKYLNSPETPVFSKSKILYGLNRAKKAVEKADQVLVVEGYMDVIACHQAGILNVVATLGTSLTDEHVRLIRRYTKNVVLSFDSDEAGVRAALRAAELFASNIGAGAAGESGTLRVLSLPPGEDPDSLVGKGEVAAFRKAIAAALSVPEFRLKTLLARYDMRTEEGKMAFLREALLVVANVPSVLEQDLLLRRLASYHPAFAAGGSRAEESLRAEMARLRENGTVPDAGSNGPPSEPLRGDIVVPPRRSGFGKAPVGRQTSYSPRPTPVPQPSAPPPPQRTAAESAERTVLLALLSEDWARPTAKALRGVAEKTHCMVLELFSTARLGRLADALLEPVEGHYSTRQTLEQLTDPSLVDLASELTLEEDRIAGLTQEAIADCLLTLRKRRIMAIKQKITVSEQEGNRTLTDEELRQWTQLTKATKNGADPEE